MGRALPYIGRMKLRDYQRTGIDQLWQWFRENPTGNPLIAAPTGTGKSLLIAGILQDVALRWPGTRVTVTTHVKELIEQNYNKVHNLLPQSQIGIYSAGLGRRDNGRQFTFTGIQSVYQMPRRFRDTQLLLIDEAHLVPANTNTTYRKFIDGIMTFNPNLRVIGLTATPYRLGLGMLVDNGIFTDVAVDQTTPQWWQYFIQNGYLVPLVPKAPGTQLNTSEIKIQNGDFATSEVVAALDKQGVTEAAVKETIALAKDRKSWLVFASSIEYAERIAALFRAYGVTAGVIHSKMHDKQRNAVLEDYKAGRIRCLVNRDILTTGFDDPKTDCIVMLRPTQSPGLWVQMLGRGTRPYPGKKDCLVLDFARNASVLGPIDNPTVPQAAKKIAGGQKRLRLILPVMKVCPKCQTYSPEGSATCSQCGFVFPIIPKHEKSADTLQLLSGTTGTPVVIKPNQWLTVGRMFAQKYTSRAGKDMMKVTYYCGKRTIADYVGFEHPGIMAYKARKWWQAHGGTYPLPRTYADALARLGELKTPHRIEVNFNTKVPEVVNYGFQPTAATGTAGSVDA